jgi:hypothetical protein
LGELRGSSRIFFFTTVSDARFDTNVIYGVTDGSGSLPQ